jgi:DNA repair protein RecN (Recombination protein N)
MLIELTIKNFAIIDDLTLKVAPGFNVLTGETGAGKSIILDAVSLLLGGRASNEEIRSGEAAAVVEGLFVLTPGRFGRSPAVGAGSAPWGPEHLPG